MGASISLSIAPLICLANEREELICKNRLVEESVALQVVGLRVDKKGDPITPPRTIGGDTSVGPRGRGQGGTDSIDI